MPVVPATWEVEAKELFDISSKVRNETRVPTLPTPIQQSPGILSQSSKARKRNKRNTNR
jgi:hypothetical protein